MQNIGFVGFGEAGLAFAKGLGGQARLLAYDAKLDVPACKSAMRAQMQAGGAQPCTLAELKAANAVFCLVTADQALAAAQHAAPHLATGSLWLDGNSCAPSTKRAAQAVIAAAGGAYVDMAIMAPVHTTGHETPVLVSGPHTEGALTLVQQLGMKGAGAGAKVGDASTIKMLRSVIIKGMEALTAEAFLAARRAGVEQAVIASLQASDGGIDWQARGAYNLERMLVHGARRAAEMQEVVRCLADLGLPSRMASATVTWQADLAAMGLTAGPDDLAARADLVLQAMS
jgi:3-hydroxyisobutyrate dehydrogenase-like beta-hydroxyacid dehydrogenase